MPARIDITAWRGDNAPDVIWQFPEGIVLGGSTFELSVFAGSTSLLMLSSEAGDLAVDNDARRVTWLNTSAQSRAIPLGKISQYELRRVVVDGRQTLANGYVTGQGGNPSDV